MPEPQEGDLVPAHRPRRPVPMHEWDPSGAPEPPHRAPAERRRPKKSYWRARDSAWFAPLVAFAILVVVIVGLYAYAQNWPPVYVVESQSMQHGTGDTLGLINTGDLVIAQKIPTSRITTYIAGRQSGYTTYGEYGDVILYQPNGAAGTPVIHRAIVYVDWIPANSTFEIPELAGLACGAQPGAVYSTSTSLGGCGWSGLPSGTVLTLYRIGWRSANVSVTLGSSDSGAHSGFITMGDNNVLCTASSCLGEADQASGISTLVAPGWIVGVARGMLPWFGALKLLLDGDASEVPTASWEFLGLTIAVLIAAAFALHYALGSRRPEDPRRAREREEREEDGDEPTALWRRLLPFLPERDRDEEERPPRQRGGSASGRPRPSVRRKGDRSGKGSDDNL